MTRSTHAALLINKHQIHLLGLLILPVNRSDVESIRVSRASALGEYVHNQRISRCNLKVRVWVDSIHTSSLFRLQIASFLLYRRVVSMSMFASCTCSGRCVFKARASQCAHLQHKRRAYSGSPALSRDTDVAAMHRGRARERRGLADSAMDPEDGANLSGLVNVVRHWITPSFSLTSVLEPRRCPQFRM